MDGDEIVETSDTEELEEINAIGKLWEQQYSSPDPPSSPLSPIPTSPLPSISVSTPPTLDDDNHVDDQSTDSEEQYNRYSLRARQAKQINPYQYDKRFYRLQMRSNPDAMVNVVSPTKAKVHSEHYHPSNEDQDDEETRTLARKARRTGEQMNVEPKDRIKAARAFPLSTSFLSKYSYSDEERLNDKTIVSDGSPPKVNAVQAKATQWRPIPRHSRLILRDDTQSDPERGMSPDSGQSLLPLSPLRDNRQNYNTDSDLDIQRDIQNLFAVGGSPLSPLRDNRQDYNTDSDLEIQGDIRNPFAVGGSHDDPDHETDLSPPNHNYESSENSSPNIRGLRLLRKAWPAVMVNQHLESLRESPAKRPRLSVHPRGSEDELGVLQPGQTRVRKVTYTQGNRPDVRGDSESSEELFTASEESDVQHGESDASFNNFRQQKPQGHIRPVAEVLEILDSDDDAESTDSDVADAEINVWVSQKALSRNHNHGNRPKQENLIDWMLSRSRTVGAPRKTTRQRSTSVTRTQGPPKLQVVTAGVRQYGDSRQTMLSFKKASKTRHSTGQGDNSVTASTRWHGVEGERRPQRKKKTQREQGQLHLHFFPSDSTHIASGRRRQLPITINMEDESFHKALAPITQNAREPQLAGPTSMPLNITRKQSTGIEMRQETRRKCSQPSAGHRDIKLDFDISHLPSGITFDPDTYLGRGWLHELVALVSGDADVSEPDTYAAHGIKLTPTMSTSSFLAALSIICDRLSDVSTQSSGEPFRWEVIMHVACQFASWLPIGASNEDCRLLQSAVHEQMSRLITRVNDCCQNSTSNIDKSVAPAVYTIHWFAIEMLTRLDHILRKRQEELFSTLLEIDKCILLLIQHLLDYGFTRTLESIQDRRQRLDARSVAQRTAESWICLINLLGCRSPDCHDGEPCWRMVHQGLESICYSVPSGLEASEVVWQTIFSLCALSQFSSHGMTTSKSRLSASWDLVAFALKQIKLTAEPDSDQTLSDRSLDKRDDYIWLITSRCFILWNRWHWCLDEASNMFRHLADIFRSRKFVNLRREPSDLPGFMLNNDIRLLSQFRSSDTAYELFLKLIVHTARSGSDTDDNLHRVSPKTSKLLSLALPVGSVPFTKTTPPSMHELSMLYNRFSVIAVALYLDSSPGKVHSRLTQARGYVRFKDADDTTRIACIRGAMHFAILMQDHQIPLDDVLLWFEEMSLILVNEYTDTLDGTGACHSTNITRDRLVFSIQVLLGSIRHIIETPHMDPTKSRSVYPDAGLLEGAWVTRIFSNATNLTNLAKTSVEIRRLVQAFLDARAAVMPIPRYSRQIPAVSEDSQDNYGSMDLDIDDAELLAALGEEHSLYVNDHEDQRVCKVVENHISPAIYRLVTKYFGEQYDNASFEEYCLDADMWINCWVGCANILVRNHKKDWSWFLRLGPQSWERIIQQSYRRRVGLQFMFMLLQLDPKVYWIHKDLFLKVLLESLVSDKVTIENKYMSLLFSIDGLQHPLFHGVLVPDHIISQAQFITFRHTTMKIIFANLADMLSRESKGEQGLTEQNQMSVGFCVGMFSAMQDIYQQMTVGTITQMTYSKFCQQVFDIFVQHPEFTLQQRLASWIEWGSNFH